ncbi:MAG: DUF3108 domain-containing protein [Hydrogenobacter thermophilus]|uniref:DUF3108 domain-containing protein n=1 Tax=Hydrogenobacter thermophilus TaxID=940 RepID=UPI001C74A91C|nr:DUF3108 domain-containing protein [Hydrogenobacter thermophilus]QWK20661.1 MAG: DUF3108 domain-containing protein [Hydrogenobacter thermophilus]
MAGRLKKALLFLTFLPLFSFANHLTACYKAYFLFLPVAETCITYKDEGKNLKVSSIVRTINVGKLVKRVYNRGQATIDKDPLSPVRFEYYQEEGEFKRYQEYKFKDGKIYVKEVKYKKLTDEIERNEEKVYKYSGYVEPYTASLILYRDSAIKSYGTVLMFYDEKDYVLPYSVIKKEYADTEVGGFNTRVVEVSPNIETKGLLKPKGRWYLWLDEETYLPVKMRLSFVIGGVEAVLTKLEGDRYLLRKLIKG